jgi:uncharacterized protein YdcH (DUF465 family)
MESHERARIESLATENEELRHLWEEHLELEKRLEEINSRPHLSPTEQVERKRIKMRKLAGKDQIAKILALSRG